MEQVEEAVIATIGQAQTADQAGDAGQIGSQADGGQGGGQPEEGQGAAASRTEGLNGLPPGLPERRSKRSVEQFEECFDIYPLACIG